MYVFLSVFYVSGHSFDGFGYQRHFVDDFVDWMWWIVRCRGR